MDYKQYHREIRKIAAQFDPEAALRDAQEEDPAERIHLRRSKAEVWITSVDNAEKSSVGGQVVTASPFIAAENIYRGTHRKSTDEEIAAEKDRREKESKRIKDEERERKLNDLGFEPAARRK